MDSGSVRDMTRTRASGGSPDPARACDLSAERRRTESLLEEEERAAVQGFRSVAGVDEVGRGCLAGPVYAGAVVLDTTRRIPGLDDSKALLPEVREELAARILRRARGVGLGSATPAEIDAMGIVEATLLAMRRALSNLRESGIEPDLVLLDAVRLPGFDAEQRSFVRGDARVAAIAAASIVAKTERDRAMDALAADFPHYGFTSNRGYGTREHLDALRRHGPCPVHRLTFDRVLPARAGRAA